jgi:subtilisin family serine protease
VFAAFSLALAVASSANLIEIRPADPKPGRVIVEFRGTPSVLAAGSLRAAHADLFERFRRDLLTVSANAAGKGATTPAIRHEYRTAFLGAAVSVAPADIDRLRRLSYVKAVHADVPVTAYGAGTEIVDARPRVNAAALAARGQGMVVAVIDSGIDYMHSALGGGFGAGFKVAGGYDFVNQDEDPMDDNGHGTHVAGTVAANSTDLIGVAPDATLLAYKVLDMGGSGTSSDIIAAIERALDPNQDGNTADHADVINLSLGGGGTADDPPSTAANNAVAAGVVVVVAAGNAGEIGSIGSPGTATDVITVGAIDDGGMVTGFSSRGPAPKLLGFKPEVVAPGLGIVSAKVGGGTVALNGTSMATPHVAGLAALLLELHPDWSPDTVKGALVTTTTQVNGNPYVRGAGRVDGAGAAQAAILVSEPGLSFGLYASKTGTSEGLRSLQITNRSTTAQDLTATAASLDPGLTISVTPSRVQLAPGESKAVEVRLTVNNAVAAFPDDNLAGGDLRFTGTTQFALPWALVRGARATIILPPTSVDALAFGPAGPKRLFRYTADSAETFLAPGATWDFLVESWEFGDDRRAMRFLIAEDVAVNGDEVVNLPESHASLAVQLLGRDENGTLISDLPSVVQQQERTVTVRLNYQRGTQSYGTATYVRDLDALFFSPFSSRWILIPEETYIDLPRMRAYSIQYPAHAGLSANRSLSRGSFSRARLLWRAPEPADLVVCQSGADTRGGLHVGSSGSCILKNISGDVAFDVFATSPTTNDSYTGVLLDSVAVFTPTIRGYENAIVASSETIPPATAYRIPNGSEVSVGRGPFYPYAYFGTNANRNQFISPLSAFTGPLGEMLREPGTATWVVTDADGATLGSGIIGGNGSTLPPAGQPSTRLHIVRGMNTLDVQFGTDANDMMAPTITSLRVVDGQNRVATTLRAGERGLLTFSAADLDYARGLTTMPSRPEATTVSWRMSGTEEWLPLAVSVTGSETGSRSSLRHVPAGDLYRVDLAPATAVPNVSIDLRIEIADVAGNRSVSTHETAFTVGNPTPPPRRRRAATH